MSTSERLSQLNFEIHKIDHQKCIAVDGTSPPTKENN
jgi:hypothetical protein